jgi:two-component system phosphate regulon response regulator PhoB
MDELQNLANNRSIINKKILLVEDDDALANTYLTRLEAEGFTVRRANNGEDALATAIEYKPDLVLLDVMMPKVSGFEVLDILRNTPETANLKIIVLTALGQEGDRQRASQLGADDYLVKSQVVISDVISRVKHHLDLDDDDNVTTDDSIEPGQQ